MACPCRDTVATRSRGGRAWWRSGCGARRERVARSFESLPRGVVCVIVPVVNQQPVLVVSIEPAGVDQGRDQPVRSSQPPDRIGEVGVPVPADVAARRVAAGPAPERLQYADSAPPLDAQLARQPADLRMLQRVPLQAEPLCLTTYTPRCVPSA